MIRLFLVSIILSTLILTSCTAFTDPWQRNIDNVLKLQQQHQKYRCPYCHDELVSEDILKRHIDHHHKYRCPYCHDELASEGLLRRHIDHYHHDHHH